MKNNENLNCVINALVEGKKLCDILVLESIKRVEKNEGTLADYHILELYSNIMKFK